MNQVDSEAKYDITDMNQQVFDIVNEMNEQILLKKKVLMMMLKDLLYKNKKNKQNYVCS